MTELAEPDVEGGQGRGRGCCCIPGSDTRTAIRAVEGGGHTGGL